MISATILVAASSLAGTATAAQHSFRMEGQPVAYTETVAADGTRHIQGQRISDRQSFRFKVRADGRVSGHVGDTPVRFRVDRNR